MWDEDRIGFHKDQVNEKLAQNFPQENLQGKTVFVPLCGKSKDMMWFKEQGMQVIGNELSEKGVKDFFKENNLEFTVKKISASMKLYRSETIEIYQGDIFELPKFGEVDYIYDRASMIALPPELRKQYAEKLIELFKERFCLFLITMEYNQDIMPGPPFSVPQKEVEDFYKDFKIEVLYRENGAQEHFKKTGRTITLNHVVYKISS